MTPDQQIAMIQEWLAREGRMEGNDLIVPEDFFRRLNAALNADQPTSLDQIIDALVNSPDAPAR